MRPLQAVPRVAPIASASAIALAWAFAGPGCASHQPVDQLAQAVAVGERPVAMEGSAVFFGGELSATATISRGIGKGIPGGGKGRHGAARAEMPDVNGMESEEAMAYVRARQSVGSPMPPVTMHLWLKNLTSNPLSVEIIDFDSDLGNFAVRPPSLTVPGGQELEPEPMISQMGVTSDDIPIKVTLKKNGRRETQVVRVRSLQGPAAPR